MSDIATRWFVTTRHLDMHTLEGRQPWGTRHARRSEDSTTACGIQLVDWRAFWHLPFGAGTTEACVDCVRVTHGSPRLVEAAGSS